jgi:predicted component of type VI protein secretion system
MAFILVRLDGPSAGEQFPFDQVTVTVGRAEDCDLCLLSGSLSRKHATLSREKDGRYALKDLGSSNGTFVNEKRVTGTVSLGGGEALRFGAVTFKFERMVEEETAPSLEEQATRMTAAPPLEEQSTRMTAVPAAALGIEDLATRLDLSAPVPRTLESPPPAQRQMRPPTRPLLPAAMPRALGAAEGAVPDSGVAPAPTVPSPAAPSAVRRVLGNVAAYGLAAAVLLGLLVPLVRAAANGSLDVKRWFSQEELPVLPERAQTETGSAYCGRAYQAMLQLCCAKQGSTLRGSVCDFGAGEGAFLACVVEEQAHAGCTGFAPAHGGGECGRCVAECEEQPASPDGSQPCRKLCQAEGYCI